MSIKSSSSSLASLGEQDSNCNRNQNRFAYPLHLSKGVLVISFMTSAILSFLAGRYAIQTKNESAKLINPPPRDKFFYKNDESHPLLSLHHEKNPPKHKYLGMEFNQYKSRRVINSHIQIPIPYNTEKACIVMDNGHKQCSIDNSNNGIISDEESGDHEDDDSQNEEEEEHLPVGQHILIDIKNVDGEFLNSDARLAKAMIELIVDSKLTLLSYHCHGLTPYGVSCAGVLLESHISFHTWPESGVITLDLFTCGPGKLVPLIPLIKKLFAIPQIGASTEPLVRWIHKVRGFASYDDDSDDENIDFEGLDLFRDIADACVSKELVASVQTDFQTIDIYDFWDDEDINPSIVEDGASYLAKYKKERVVFLDGTTQSTRNHLEAYHEALVHAPMLTHANPKKVSIIGGGEGATLREVLKYRNLEKVDMIEIDEKMVYASKKYLPEWSDCSDIVGSTKWCGDDPRAHLYFEDGLAWFIDRYSESGRLSKDLGDDKYDVIIMDALDPQDEIPFAEKLYTDPTFISSLYNALSEDGIIAFQLGYTAFGSGAPDIFGPSRRRAILMDMLQLNGFETFHIYEDGHCGFLDPWSFLVVSKTYEEHNLQWFMNPAEMQIQIHDRILETNSGKPNLKYFDGATMKGYQIPHKAFEVTFCRKIPVPHWCTLEHKQIENVPKSDLEVKFSTVGDVSGRGVFTKVDIKKSMKIAGEVESQPVIFPPSATSMIVDFEDEDIEEMEKVYNYMDGYGWQVDTWGDDSYYVDAGYLTFTNHGCNGTYNVAAVEKNKAITEQNAKESDRGNLHSDPSFQESNWLTYNPARDRQLHRINAKIETALVDIKAGDELLTDYLDFSEWDSWFPDVQDLKRICDGKDVGFITEKERKDIIE